MKGLRGLVGSLLGEHEVEAAPTDAAGWTRKGVWLYQLSQDDEALRCFDEALKLEPENPVVWRHKGLSLLSLERHQEAVDCLQQALSLAPEDEWIQGAWCDLGLAYDNLGAVPRAAAAFRQYLALMGDIETEETAYARDRLEEFVDVQTSEGDAVVDCCNRGIQLASLGNHDAALAWFDRALELEPFDETAWYDKGIAEQELGNTDVAVFAFQRYMSLEPEDDCEEYQSAQAVVVDAGSPSWDIALETGAGWRGAAERWIESERFQEAIHCLNLALALDPENAADLASKGECLSSLINLGRTDDAITCFDRAIACQGSR